MLALSQKKAEAAFPGKNGRIAYVAESANTFRIHTIYTINPSGGGRSKVTKGEDPSYSPDGK